MARFRPQLRRKGCCILPAGASPRPTPHHRYPIVGTGLPDGPCGKVLRIRQKYRRNGTQYRESPSHSFVVPAPFDKGAMRRLRRQPPL